MRHLILTAATTLLAFLLPVPAAWAEWVWPLRGQVITPYRNGDDPYASGQHRGIDIAGQVGAPVVAAAGGGVRFAGTAGSSGLTVSIRTADGRYDASYLHLSSVAVREGDWIAAGQRVGTVGTTGVRSAEATHLHFGVRDAGSRHAYHDPLGFLPPAGAPPPREAPAPQPAPPSPAPAPAPVRAPADRRVPFGAPAPRRVPAPAPRRVPARAPRRVPAPAPRRVPVGAPAPGGAPVGAPAPGRVPVGPPMPRRVPAPAPHRGPGHAPGRAAPAAGGVRAPAARRVPEGAPHRTPPGVPTAPSERGVPATDRPPPAPDPEARSGPDLGLVLACLGLLAAAALLGLTRDGPKAERRAGHLIRRALHPLLGRR